MSICNHLSIRVLSSKCQHLSLQPQLLHDMIGTIFQKMSRLQSLLVMHCEKIIDIIWLEKQ
jgi:hypothetical protein